MSYYSTYIHAPLTSTAVSFTSFSMLISLTEKTRLCSRDIGSFNFSVKANKSKLSFFSNESLIWSSYTLEPEKAMAPHSITFAWKIPWAEEPGGL